jgi:hypothetical protein
VRSAECSTLRGRSALLKEIPLTLSDRPLSQAAADLIAEGRSRFKTVSCFDFVASNYELVWQVLDALPRGRFCEWGSGFGIITGLAQLLGFESSGIEIDENLAEASRKLLADFGISSRIYCGDYTIVDARAETYFVYCWPGKVNETREYFASIARPDDRLLICYGESDVRCQVLDSTAENLET